MRLGVLAYSCKQSVIGLFDTVQPTKRITRTSATALERLRLRCIQQQNAAVPLPLTFHFSIATTTQRTNSSYFRLSPEYQFVPERYSSGTSVRRMNAGDGTRHSGLLAEPVPISRDRRHRHPTGDVAIPTLLCHFSTSLLRRSLGGLTSEDYLRH